MSNRTLVALRIGYLTGRAILHMLTRKKGSLSTPARMVYRAAEVAVYTTPGRELETVHICDDCCTVAVFNHRTGQVAMLVGTEPTCPVLIAMREMAKAVPPFSLPKAKVR